MRHSRSLLVVEDNPQDLELMEAALGRLNLLDRVEVARDGERALDYLAAAAQEGRCPALALVDVKLPRTSGHDVVRQARAERRFCRMPIVMLSASAIASDVRQAYNVGANGYLQKPIGFRDLVELMTATVEFWLGHNITAQT